MFFFPGLIDHHVHLGLIDRGQLGVSLLGRIHDLGWDPAAINGLAGELPADLELRFVGPFHTAPGGYPSGRSWAPPASVRGVDSVRDAHRAVDRAVELGADAIKITLHAQFPLLDDATLAALVHAAHEHGIPAVVHAEGAGLAERAIAAGADQLAHTPWTTPLSASWIRRAAEHTRLVLDFAHPQRSSARYRAPQRACLRGRWWSTALRHRSRQWTNSPWRARASRDRITRCGWTQRRGTVARLRAGLKRRTTGTCPDCEPGSDARACHAHRE